MSPNEKRIYSIGSSGRLVIWTIKTDAPKTLYLESEKAGTFRLHKNALNKWAAFNRSFYDNAALALAALEKLVAYEKREHSKFLDNAKDAESILLKQISTPAT